MLSSYTWSSEDIPEDHQYHNNIINVIDAIDVINVNNNGIIDIVDANGNGNGDYSRKDYNYCIKVGSVDGKSRKSRGKARHDRPLFYQSIQQLLMSNDNISDGIGDDISGGISNGDGIISDVDTMAGDDDNYLAKQQHLQREEHSRSSINPYYSQYQVTFTVNWNAIPIGFTVAGGHIPLKRLARKIIQVENMMMSAYSVILDIMSRKKQQKTGQDEESLVVVEFCAGSGFVALPLSFLFPEVTFVLIDCKAASLDIARERIAVAEAEIGSKITNIVLRLGRIEDFSERFDVGIALHACGAASDVVITKCVDAEAAFVICSCCIGKIVHYRRNPHSAAFTRRLSEEQFCHLVRAADFGHPDTDSYAIIDKNRRFCKCLIESDRMLYAVGAGYRTAMLLMQPKEASPKNDIVVGWPITGHQQVSRKNPNVGSVICDSCKCRREEITQQIRSKGAMLSLASSLSGAERRLCTTTIEFSSYVPDTKCGDLWCVYCCGPLPMAAAQSVMKCKTKALSCGSPDAWESHPTVVSLLEYLFPSDSVGV